MKIISYILVLAVSVLFMLFLDGVGGSYLVGVLLLAPVLSLALTLYSRKKITCRLICKNQLLNKNENATATVQLSKSGFLPSPFVAVEVGSSFHFSAVSDSKFRITLGSKRTEQFDCSFTADYWGIGEISLKSLKITDFLGLFTFNIMPKWEFSTEKIRICPDLKDADEKSMLLLSLENSASYSDGEETKEVSFSANGTPGYEHRDYVQGDSLRSVNWKLSAKRNKLLIRKNEAVTGAKQIFVLDGFPAVNDNIEIARKNTQMIVESLLAFAKLYSKTGLQFCIYAFLEGKWKCFHFEEFADIQQLRYELASFVGIKGNESRFPDFAEENGKSCVVFTLNPDNSYEIWHRQLVDKGFTIEGVTIASQSVNDLWKTVEANNTFDYMQ